MILDKEYRAEEKELYWQKKWTEWGIYKFNINTKKPIFSIDTPPPTISGLIHVGHAMSYSQAEFIARYKRMRGFEVFYPMGFDDNGLPTERYVEKKLGVDSSKMKRSEFIKLCLEETRKGEEEFESVWTRLGISVDWSLLYSTISPEVRRISQRSFLDLYKKGRIYREKGPVIWCPECRTAVAQAEQDHIDRESKLYTILFDKVDGKDVLIATTRPELMGACVGILVHPEDERHRDLVGKEVRVPIFGQKVKVMEDEEVDPEFGTGVVMVCTFGDKVDIEWWRKFGLDLRIIIDEGGRLTVEPYKGLKIEEARRRIVEDLKEKGLLKKEKKVEQSVGVHERCGTPTEIYMAYQWYVKILDMKEKMLELGDELNWYPESMKSRYVHWVNGLKWDWCISRQRHYGIPFPVWYCKACGEIMVAEEDELPVDPLEQQPKRKCPKCGCTKFEGDKDVMDTWATSAVTPLINGKWGEQNSIMDKIYPMSLRPQAHDIIRTWLFYTVLKCYLHTGKAPWRDVMISGHGQDEKGEKMSKSKGNVIEPLDVVRDYSADALRWWSSSVKLGEDLPFKIKDVITGQKFLLKLWNSSRFVSMHLEDYKPREEPGLRVIDRWILDKLNEVIEKVTESFEEYGYSRAKRMVEHFFWYEFCDNYLEMVKHRLYNPDVYGKESREAAQYTLYQVLLASLKMLAPIIPHITEEIYQALFQEHEKDISIHISRWPETKENWVDPDARGKGEIAKAIVTAVRQWKSQKKIPLNKEVSEIVIDAPEEVWKVIEEISEDIKGTVKTGKIERGSIKKGKESVAVEDKGIFIKVLA
ncbi:MAG: valine--tRNA ligase [Candidatus Aenigmatarchaeota archaeon]|nr:MAG: valine--tRNA ligase [Candidatus Aenigmarchaeota archaeon]